MPWCAPVSVGEESMDAEIPFRHIELHWGMEEQHFFNMIIS